MQDQDITSATNNASIMASGFSHSFDTGIAEALGLHASIVYNHILYWLKHNFIDGKNFVEEKTWTYNSYEKMAEYMPYFTKEHVRRAIEDLLKSGMIIKEKFNPSKFDHRPWYTVPDQSLIRGSKNHYDEANSPRPQGAAATTTGRPRLDYNTQEEPQEKPVKIHKAPKAPICVSPSYDAEKKERSESVFTTDEQHEKLVASYGAEFTEQCYRALADWKKSADPKIVKKHQCDYLRITNWVVNSLKEKQLKDRELAKREERLTGAPSSTPSKASNEELSKNAYRDWISPYYNIDVCYDRVEFIPKSGAMQPDSLKFSEQEGAFASQLNGLLNKRGFIKRAK